MITTRTTEDILTEYSKITQMMGWSYAKSILDENPDGGIDFNTTELLANEDIIIDIKPYLDKFWREIRDIEAHNQSDPNYTPMLHIAPAIPYVETEYCFAKITKQVMNYAQDDPKMQKDIQIRLLINFMVGAGLYARDYENIAYSILTTLINS